jgi:acetyl-CoA acetyltransferase family protein
MRRVVLVEGCRTPFVKAGGAMKDVSLTDMSTVVVEALLKKLCVDPRVIEEISFGTVLLNPRFPNLAREIVLRSTLPKSINAHFISNNCITSLVAAAYISDAIRSGRIGAGIAGGSESMSQPVLMVGQSASKWFLHVSRAKTLGEKMKLLRYFRKSFLRPEPPSPKEPSTGLTMGEHCELIAKEWNISRGEQDAVAFRSHQRASKALADGIVERHIVPVGEASVDSLIRKDTSLEKLGGLSPVFDKSPAGTLTAGNSSALTDGASAICLMDEGRARELSMTPLARIEAIEFAAVSPEEGLLMAPVLAVPRLLKKAGVSVGEIGVWELHEAFGAQVAATRKAWKEGWQRYPHLERIGEIEDDKINIYGGSLAYGHPFAATGGRILLSLATALRERGCARGIASVCAAGGMGCAVLLQSVD